MSNDRISRTPDLLAKSRSDVPKGFNRYTTKSQKRAASKVVKREVKFEDVDEDDSNNGSTEAPSLSKSKTKLMLPLIKRRDVDKYSNN